MSIWAIRGNGPSLALSLMRQLTIRQTSDDDLHHCLSPEEALLEFRDEFPIDELDPNPWNKNTTDCCLWKGVMCDDRSGQVISLNLADTSLNGSFKTNSSLFRLQYLRHLKLSYCNIQGEIPSSLGNLSRLTVIDLSHNNLVGEIPASIGNLKRLRHVELGANTLIGAIPSSLGILNQLRYLSLAANELTGEIPSSLGNLSSLLELRLSINHLVGQVPASIGNLNDLQVISLGQNTLNGTIPTSFANLTKLYHISLRSNNFTSTLPFNMSGFHNLEHFDVAANSFLGSFPKSLFTIPSLQVVYLDDNQFTGPIEFVNTSKSSSSPKLEILSLSSNIFIGLVPESISNFLNLGEINLCENNFNGPIPRSISKLVNLHDLNLANNNLKGQVSASLWRLTTVTLSNNFFSSFENPSEETVIQALDLNSNSFQGPFPHWVCNAKGLSFLDLSNNLFNGSIPLCLKNSIVSFSDLILRNNSFSGPLPDIFASATELRSLDVSRNHLEGNLPKSLMNCKSLQLVNMESNSIKDVFPTWLGSLPSLHVLILRSNEFHGTLHHHHVFVGFQSLRIIDISRNDFTGTLPPHCFSSWRGMTILREEDDPYMADIINDSVLFGLEEICGKIQVSPPTSQQHEQLSEPEEQLFNWGAAAIAYGPGVFCGLVIGHIFTSHYHKSWSKKNTIKGR
ncbi:hypothetical protein Bca101_027562 [Brassica carinata]